MITQAARFIRFLALTITVLGLASACSSNPVSTEGSAAASGKVAVRGDVGEKAAAVAVDQVGVPYRYGGSNPSGFDCSGLVQYSYSRAGMQLPRTTGQLWTSTRSVGRHELRTGDLLFFRIDGKMSHVGLYLGGQRFVHAPSSGRKVSVASLDSPYYNAAFTRAGRPR
jgi:cell wall-associated NlpC family hydrolase